MRYLLPTLLIISSCNWGSQRDYTCTCSGGTTKIEEKKIYNYGRIAAEKCDDREDELNEMIHQPKDKIGGVYCELTDSL